MIATLSTKGQTVIPESIREAARLRAGDTLDVGYAHGMIILRKRVPLTPAKIRALLQSGKSLPAQTEADEAEVLDAVRRVRARRK
jgi:AbrB family looped-hinge helix DNA binding protein